MLKNTLVPKILAVLLQLMHPVPSWHRMKQKDLILAVFKQKIKLFASRENLSEMLSHSDVDLASIGKQKTALFIVIQDEKKTYHSLVTIFAKTML